METCDSARHDLMTLQTTLKLLSVYQPRAIVCTQWNICFVSSLLHVVCRLVHFLFDSFGVWEFSLVFIVSYVIYFIDSWWSSQSKNNQSFFQQPQNEDRTRPSKATWKVNLLTIQKIISEDIVSMRRTGQGKWISHDAEEKTGLFILINVLWFNLMMHNCFFCTINASFFSKNN